MIEWRENQHTDALFLGTRNGVLLFEITRFKNSNPSDEFVYELTSDLPGVVRHREFDIVKLKEVAQKQFEVWLDRTGLQVRQEMQISLVGLSDPASLASMMENEDG